jgi:chaperonin cofactor prefoldin
MLHGSSGWCTTEKKRSHLTEKFGAEEAEKKLEQTKKLRSDAVTKKNIGRVLTEETREKISSKLRDGYAEGRISTRPPHHLQRRLFEILLGS